MNFRLLLPFALLLTCAARSHAEPAVVSPDEAAKLLGGPTTVTVSATDNSAQSVVEAMLHSAKVKFVPGEFALQPGRLENHDSVTVEFQNTPFWDAATQIEAQSDFGWNSYERNELSAVSEGGARLRGRVGAQTPILRIVANGLTRQSTRSRIMRLRDDDAQPETTSSNDSLSLSVVAFLDPKLRIGENTLRFSNLEVESGGETQPVKSNGTLYQRSNFLLPTTITLPATLAPDSRVTLRGRLQAVCVFKTQELSVPLNGARNLNTTVADATYTLKSATVAEDAVSVELKYRGPGFPKTDADVNGIQHDMSGVARTFRVLDADGHALMSQGGGYSGSTDERSSGFEGRFNFARNNARGPFSLAWNAPTDVRILDVPFEFRDLPVP